MALWQQPRSARTGFDGIVIGAAEGVGSPRVAGLSLEERAERVLLRLGARRVLVLRGAKPGPELRAWRECEPAAALAVIRAGDQLVHTPLLSPLLEPEAGERAVAVNAEGRYAGALVAGPSAADEVLDLLAGQADDRAVERAWRARGDVARVPHGALAAHPATTPQERRAAARMLYQIVHKPQDGPVTRWLYRPVSLAITRLLLPLPITPNQVSFAVAALGVVGLYFTAQYEYRSVLLGSAIILVAAYLDGCDGEIARLKLLSSKVGAWIDTLTDEATTVGYLIALGIHNYLRHPEPWVAATIAFGAASYLMTIYAIYYFLIRVAGSANSQDYVDALELAPGDRPGTRTLRPIKSAQANGDAGGLARLAAVLPHLARRDFINWGALVFAALELTAVSYFFMLLGGAVSVSLVFFRDHLRLRRQLRELHG